jgi:hypothetical protein
VPFWVVVAVAVVLVVGGGFLFYRSLDTLYPQPIWKYFRPLPSLPSGRALYRDPAGQLFVADIGAAGGDRQPALRLYDASVPDGTREIVRDAAVLPGSRQVAYYATERRQGQPDTDRLKLIGLDGSAARTLLALETLGEPLRPAIFTSASGRTVAVSNRDRTEVFYVDVANGGAPVAGETDTPPERMVWNRNGDSHTALLPGQPAFASSPDGSLRAQVRDGKRRAPECGEASCERVQELAVGPAAIASTAPFAVIYGAYRSFSADGWGLIPTQPAQRLFGRLVWSPDNTQLLFSTIDGADERVYVIGADGKTRPRLLLEDGEVLDWVA